METSVWKFLEQWRLVHTVKDKHLREKLKKHSTLSTDLMSSMSLAALGRTDIRFQLSSAHKKQSQILTNELNKKQIHYQQNYRMCKIL